MINDGAARLIISLLKLSVWKQYTDILLYEVMVPVSKELQENTYSQDELNDISRVILAPFKKQMTEELLALEKQIPGSRALFAGTCEMCESCNKESGEPCRQPGSMRYSIEALGGNVAKALQIYFDDEIIWAKDGRLPEHFILLGGLLRNSIIH